LVEYHKLASYQEESYNLYIEARPGVWVNDRCAVLFGLVGVEK
jgi:hypothetical protein